ncbi:hypothetical protein [Roseimaritima ulvae]|uniref:Uncharacterized protein n=1 Tax=Roseimaritima ulvae TaxID=980254 RepID=A0A5B9QRR3_9BACT|nr:hypothetical protein [Roseimaritima ulvae]QEG39746.1 hypothetical protein UC8_17440 [Roseimaritima ulvae]
MKISVLSAGLAAVLGFTLVGCDVEKTREGDLPEVEVQEGQMPAYDVDGPEVDVSMEESKVKVPDVDVDMEEKTVETPNVDIDLPEDN